jgi:hypothetical protein
MGMDVPIKLGLAEKRFGAHRNAATIEKRSLKSETLQTWV